MAATKNSKEWVSTQGSRDRLDPMRSNSQVKIHQVNTGRLASDSILPSGRMSPRNGSVSKTTVSIHPKDVYPQFHQKTFY